MPGLEKSWALPRKRGGEIGGLQGDYGLLGEEERDYFGGAGGEGGGGGRIQISQGGKNNTSCIGRG